MRNPGLKKKVTPYSKTNEEFIEAVKTSLSIREALGKLGLIPKGGNHATFKRRVAALNIDTSHFTGAGHLKGKNHSWGRKIPTEELLVENCLFQGSKLKARLIAEGLLRMVCGECDLADTWNDKPIMLQLDHINGVNTDNRIENLRILCPNCHSQTDTFCARNKKSHPKMIHDDQLCQDCGGKVHAFSKRCKECDNKYRKTEAYRLSISFNNPHHEGYAFTKEEVYDFYLEIKDTSINKLSKRLNINRFTIREALKKYELYKLLPKKIKVVWPSNDELQKLLLTKSITNIAKELGISRKSVGKRIKKLNLVKHKK